MKNKLIEIINKKILEDRIKNAELSREGKNDNYHMGKINAYNEILDIIQAIEYYEVFLEKYGKYFEEKQSQKEE